MLKSSSQKPLLLSFKLFVLLSTKLYLIKRSIFVFFTYFPFFSTNNLGMKKLILLLLPVIFSLPVWGQFENFELLVPQKDHAFVMPDVENTVVSTTGNVDPVLVDMLNTTLANELSIRGAIGFSAALVLPDGEAWSGAVGRNNAAGDPFLPEMVSGIGSVTKTITGACIMELVEEGKVNLDAPISDYLGSFPNVTATATVRQLLNHTSGIYSYTDNPAVNDSVSKDFSRVWAPEEILNNFILAPLFNPGDSWSYSNTNYVLLGLIIEEVTGNEYHVEIRNRFWSALNLEGIYLYPQETPTETFVNLWADLFGGGTALDLSILGVTREGLFSMGWAAGAVIETPETIARWMKLLTDGEAITPTALAMMEDFLPLTNTYGYGLGLTRTRLPDGNYIFGHSGNIIYQSEVNAVPDLGISISVLTNDGTQNGCGNTWLALYNTYKAYLALVGTNETFNAQPLHFFPNPTSGNVTLDLTAGSLDYLEVRNTLGQVVWKTNQTLMGNVEIPAADWTSGIYQLMGKDGNQSWQGKMIKN